MVTAQEAATIYLAEVLRRATLAWEARFGAGTLRKVDVNAAAPLNQTWGDTGEANATERKATALLHAAYERMIWAANELRKAPVRPWAEELAEARKLLGADMPLVAARRTAVMAETHAAVTAFLLRPENASRRGLFATVDVGAGTTDVAFFWAAGRSLPMDEEGFGPPVAVYYRAGSAPVGADDYCRLVSGETGRGLAEVREALSGGATLTVPPGASELSDRVWGQFKRSWGMSYAAVPGQSLWYSSKRRGDKTDGHFRPKLLFVGGGSRLSPLIGRVRNEPPTYAPSCPGFYETHEDLEPPPFQVLDADGSLRPRQAAQWHLLTIAFGLAHRRVDMPLAEVAKEKPELVTVLDSTDRDELYPK